MLGILPMPKQYSIDWPNLDSLSDNDKATIASTKTTALQAYVQGGVESIISPLDFLTKILGMDEEEANQIIDKAMKSAQASPEDDEAPMTLPPKGDPGHPATGQPPAPQFSPDGQLLQQGDDGNFKADPSFKPKPQPTIGGANRPAGAGKPGQPKAGGGKPFGK